MYIKYEKYTMNNYENLQNVLIKDKPFKNQSSMQGN